MSNATKIGRPKIAHKNPNLLWTAPARNIQKKGPSFESFSWGEFWSNSWIQSIHRWNGRNYLWIIVNFSTSPATECWWFVRNPQFSMISVEFYTTPWSHLTRVPGRMSLLPQLLTVWVWANFLPSTGVVVVSDRVRGRHLWNPWCVGFLIVGWNRGVPFVLGMLEDFFGLWTFLHRKTILPKGISLCIVTDQRKNWMDNR